MQVQILHLIKKVEAHYLFSYFLTMKKILRWKDTNCQFKDKDVALVHLKEPYILSQKNSGSNPAPH